MPSPFPAGTELTHILVVADAVAARDFSRDVVGAEVVREYGGTRSAASSAIRDGHLLELSQAK